MSLSCHCGQRGRPPHGLCTWDRCQCECHSANQAQNKGLRTPERVESGADKRSPSRVLGRSATEASTDYQGVGS